MIQSQDDIAIPVVVPGRKKGSGQYADMAKMLVGQSFLAPKAKNKNRLCEAVRKEAKNLGIVIVARVEGDGFRVWRLA